MKTIIKLSALLLGGGAILLAGCATAPYCGPTGCYYPTNTTYYASYNKCYSGSCGCSYRYCTIKCYSGTYCPNKCCLDKYRYYNSYLYTDDRDVYYNGY